MINNLVSINSKRLLVLVGVLGIWSGCLGLVSAANNAEIPVSMTIKVDQKDANSEVLGFDINNGEGVKLELYAAGATGYEWVVVSDSLKLVDIVTQATSPVDANSGLSGGKVRTGFIIQAKSGASGQETVVFSLRRFWEPAELAAKTINCEINIK